MSQPPKGRPELLGLQTDLWQQVSKLPGGQVPVVPNLGEKAQMGWFPPAAGRLQSRSPSPCVQSLNQHAWSPLLVSGLVLGTQSTQGSKGSHGEGAGRQNTQQATNELDHITVHNRKKIKSCYFTIGRLLWRVERAEKRPGC